MFPRPRLLFFPPDEFGWFGALVMFGVPNLMMMPIMILGWLIAVVEWVKAS